jgi:anti-sigma-K factor RskA
MTCAEFKELFGAFALGAVDETERAACEAHLAQPEHEGCPEALAAARATVNAIPLALPPVRPRPEIWERIAKEVEPPAALPPRRRAPWSIAAPIVGALAVAAALVLFFRERHEHETVLAVARDEVQTSTNLRRACQEELDGLRREAAVHREAVALLAAPGAKLVAMNGQTSDRAVVIFDAQQGKAAIVAHGFAAQPGKDYELWVIKGDVKKAAGLLHADATGAVAAIIDPAVLKEGVDAFAVTLEPAGGGESPRGPILMVGAVG